MGSSSPTRAFLDGCLPQLAVVVLGGWVEGLIRLRHPELGVRVWGGAFEALVAAYIQLAPALGLGLLFALAPGLRRARPGLRVSVALAFGLLGTFAPAAVGAASGFLGPRAGLGAGALAAVVLAVLATAALRRRRLPGPGALGAWLVVGLVLPVGLLRGLPHAIPEQAALPAVSGAMAPADAPSVLLVSIDTLRSDRVGASRGGVPLTPHLDRMAEEGARLFCTADSNQTVPTHASLLTGAGVLRHGTVVNGLKLPRRLPTLAEAFHEAGWRTGAVVSNPLLHGAYGFARGFEVYDDEAMDGTRRSRAFKALRRVSVRWQRLWPRNRLVRPLTVLFGYEMFREGERGTVALERGRGLLEQLGAAAGPFFAFVHFMDPHAPYRAPEGWYGGLASAEQQALLPWRGTRDFMQGVLEFEREHRPGDAVTEARLEAYRALYDEEVRFVDDCVGRLWEAALAAAGGRPLWIVVTSDHGEQFAEHLEGDRRLMDHAKSLFEEELRVPLIVWGVDAAPGEAPATTAEVARFLAGRALGPAVRERLAEGSAAAPVHAYRKGRKALQVCLREGSLKLMLEWDEAAEDYQPVALYDLGPDPGEQSDLLPGQPELGARLHGRFREVEAGIRPVERSALEDTFGLSAEELAEMGYVGDEEEEEAADDGE